VKALMLLRNICIRKRGGGPSDFSPEHTAKAF